MFNIIDGSERPKHTNRHCTNHFISNTNIIRVISCIYDTIGKVIEKSSYINSMNNAKIFECISL